MTETTRRGEQIPGPVPKPGPPRPGPPKNRPLPSQLNVRRAPAVKENSWESLFRLGPEATPPGVRKLALSRYQEYLEEQRSHFLGYQADESLDYRDDLSWMLGYHVNNIGDPFTDGNFTLNSKVVERSVLDYYATLWNAETPHGESPDSYWGYVLTMGSTEGNLYGMWNARDYLGGKALIVDPSGSAAEGVPPRLLLVRAKPPEDDANVYTPVAFYSEDTHYSFTKAARVVGMSTFY
ncbi:MAG: histidine decarboxylase, partial [Actinomycetota bacterium]|nr:histidine decarboxylase [Actinomycetota bacterium]